MYAMIDGTLVAVHCWPWVVLHIGSWLIYVLPAQYEQSEVGKEGQGLDLEQNP